MSGDAQARARTERVLRLWEQVEAMTGRRPVCWQDMTALAAAAMVLDTRPRDAASARLAMHDVMCHSGADCGNRVEHSRTNTETVRALRKVLAAEARP